MLLPYDRQSGSIVPSTHGEGAQVLYLPDRVQPDKSCFIATRRTKAFSWRITASFFTSERKAKKRMSTSFNAASPQAPVRVDTVNREQTTVEAVARQNHLDASPAGRAKRPSPTPGKDVAASRQSLSTLV
jgi:hypothetical protein